LVSNPNKRVQDGLKTELLCKNCEQLFSKSEKWFSENIFKPYLDNSNYHFVYDSNLYYFLMSIAWRICVFKKSSMKNHKYESMINDAENEWHAYLSKNVIPKKYNRVHLFFTEIAENMILPVDNWNRYITRTIDTTIGYSDSICFLYYKFSKFLVFVEINGFKDDYFKNTLIDPYKGELIPPQVLKYSSISNFLVQRAKDSSDIFGKNISKKQTDSILSKMKTYDKKFLKSDLYKAMEADFNSISSSEYFNIDLDDNSK